MAGGFRNGAGRPKGSSNAKASSVKAFVAEAARVGVTPLEYLLSVMNDAAVDPVRRDRAAIAAAPFLHQKPDVFGKKIQADIDARDCARGTDWQDLLERRAKN